ncbi:MAG: hypothetical protein R8M38_09795 [Mariprofundaceae bacterium]
METVSFELDTNLRLHPQRLELGKADLLTDALTLPFTDIEKRLAHYVTGINSAEADSLRQSMKRYLSRLNANPLIPLHFRLKVLRRFELELDLFDVEMTAAILNAHKIAVDLVQEAAREESGYYTIVVDMVAGALELAVQLLRSDLEKYHSPAVITTRQVFNLARLGLSVLPILPEESIKEKNRLLEVVAHHELYRKLDFYGKAQPLQKMAWQEMDHHILSLRPYFCRKGEKPAHEDNGAYLATSIQHPHLAAELISKMAVAENDLIIIPMDAFLERLINAINRVETVMKDPKMQQHDLHTEGSLQSTVLGGNAILDAIRHKKRNIDRARESGSRIIFQWDAGKGFTDSHTASALDEYEYAPSEGDSPEAWSVANKTDDGVGLERLSFEPLTHPVDSLVGLSWIPHTGEPMLGYVSWYKIPKLGEQRIGVRFFKENHHLFKGELITGEAGEHVRRGWNVLVEKNSSPPAAIFPDCKMVRGMTIKLADGTKNAHFSIEKVIKTGPNYSICQLRNVEELNRETNLSFQ